MTDNHPTEAMTCPIGEVLISRVVEIQEMMEDYKLIKANAHIRGQETFSREQAKLYEDQFESCINDLLAKLEMADIALATITAPTTMESSIEIQTIAKEALMSLRQ
jgi:hypothetical protein